VAVRAELLELAVPMVVVAATPLSEQAF
jgi:hypothetical protein